MALSEELVAPPVFDRDLLNRGPHGQQVVFLHDPRHPNLHFLFHGHLFFQGTIETSPAHLSACGDLIGLESGKSRGDTL